MVLLNNPTTSSIIFEIWEPSLNELKGVRIDRNGDVVIVGRDIEMPHSITTMGNKRKKLIQTYTDSPIIQGTPVMRTITEWMTITERHMDNVKDTETVTSMIFTTVTIEPSIITITQTPVYSDMKRINVTYQTTVVDPQTYTITVTENPVFYPRSTTKAISTLAYDTETLSSRIYQPNVYK